MAPPFDRVIHTDGFWLLTRHRDDKLTERSCCERVVWGRFTGKGDVGDVNVWSSVNGYRSECNYLSQGDGAAPFQIYSYNAEHQAEEQLRWHTVKVHFEFEHASSVQRIPDTNTLEGWKTLNGSFFLFLTPSSHQVGELSGTSHWPFYDSAKRETLNVHFV